MKPSVYIETTIISYLTSKPSRDLIIAAHQQITTEWWTDVRSQVECFVSPFLIDEASRGDAIYAQKRLGTKWIICFRGTANTLRAGASKK